MAYHLSVHIETDGVPRRELYHKALGADDTICEYWYLPACQLGLQLLAQVYHEGLEIRPEQFDKLSDELQRLEEYWQTTGAGTSLEIPHNTSDGRAYLPFSEHLK